MNCLKKRRDFVAAAKGRKTVRRDFVLQSLQREDEGPARFGFTVTKKTARKAVQRNRIRRRLREAVRLLPKNSVSNGYDHVLIGRRSALTGQFAPLCETLQTSIESATLSADSASRNSGDKAKHGK